MDFEITDIKKKIDNYFLGNLSKEELGDWAKIAYYDLLKGEYLEIKKIVVYPFLKMISTFHIHEDEVRDIFPCSIDEIKFIRDVLNGKHNEAYSIEIGIPWSINGDELGLDKRKKSQYIKLIGIFNRYLNKQTFTEEDYEECINAFNMSADKPGTIQFILENYIRSFLKNNIDWEEQSLDFHQGYGLYLRKRKTENDILKKVVAYLDCYIGERNFGVDILFISGEPQITFFV